MDFIPQLFRTAYGTFHALRTRGQFQPCAVSLEQHTAFRRHGVGHGQNNLKTFRSSHPCQPHTGVAGGGLYDGGTGFENTAFNGILYHCKRDTVLHAPARIEILQFEYEVSNLSLESAYPKHRRSSYQFCQIIVNHII